MCTRHINADIGTGIDLTVYAFQTGDFAYGSLVDVNGGLATAVVQFIITSIGTTQTQTTDADQFGVSLDIENYCTLRFFFVHLSCGMGTRLTGSVERKTDAGVLCKNPVYVVLH